MKKIIKIFFFACSILFFLISSYCVVLSIYTAIEGSKLGSYENWSGLFVFMYGYTALMWFALSSIFFFWFSLLKKLTWEKINQFSVVKKFSLVFSIVLTILIFFIIIINYVFPIFKSYVEQKTEESQKEKTFTVLIDALKNYSKENNGLYPTESKFCTIGKDCFNFVNLISPYLNNFPLNQNLGIYYQSFDGSDCTLQNAIGTFKYGYSCNLDRVVSDTYLFRGRHTESECFAIPGAGSVIGNPFGVCNLSKGSVFPQGWTENQFYTKFSPEGY
ncbi:MAG TPA: hypothetical protein PLD14_02615 [Candidatus Pacearchaeota archaeon]|nr:hypothetical protein [Candidatus Pacearchaeota archaeon]HPR80094.1 hypothetical protein [Candidatus Pacearchaeota archaeon]